MNTVIDGLRCDVKGAELIAHCTERAAHHKAECDRYSNKLALLHETKAKMVRETGQISREDLSARLDSSNFKGEARDEEIERKASTARNKYSYFKYIGEHVLSDHTYRLYVEDLQKLEIVDRIY